MKLTLLDLQENEELKDYPPISKAVLSNFNDGTHYKALTNDGKIVITRHPHYGASYIDHNTIRVLPKHQLRIKEYEYKDLIGSKSKKKEIDVPMIANSQGLF